jgi:hypothetical protein
MPGWSMRGVRYPLRYRTGTGLHLYARRRIRTEPAGGGGGPATYTLVAQGKGNGNDGFTTAGVDTTGATLLVVTVAWANSAPTLSDSKGNTWETARDYAPFGPGSRIYYCWNNPTVGTGHTITLTGTDVFASAQFWAWDAGTLSADPLDQSNENVSFSSTTWTSGSVTPTEPGELVIVHCNYDNAPSMPTVDQSFLSPSYGDVGAGAVYNGSGSSYLIQTSAAAVNPTFTKASGATNNYGTIASFKVGEEAGGGPGEHTLTGVADTANGNTADTVTLTQAHTLSGVADTANGNTTENVALESWSYITDLSDYATAGSISRWVKMQPTGSHTTGRQMHVNNVDDVDVVDDVVPPDDVVYSAGVLWIAAGAQNYGGTNLRLTQPIDLTEERTIKMGVALDAQNFVNGWLELVVTDKPYAGAAWSDTDNADGATPQYGFVVKLNYSQYFADGSFRPTAALDVWDEWVQTNYDPDDTTLAFTVGSIHTVTVTFDGTTIAATVDGAAWWSDSWTLPSELLTAEAWVHIGVHNHATLKYTPFPDGMTSRWNQLAWDGATPDAPTVHRVPDDWVSHSMAVHSPPGTGTDGGSGPGVDGGWDVPTAPLVVTGVPAIVDRAILVFTLQTSLSNDPSTTVVTYELNGNGAHNTASINAQIPGDGRTFYIVEDVDAAELVTGSNDIEITSTNPGGGLTPHVANVELLVWEGTEVTLVVADTANGNTADTVVLTQAHTLSGVADTANGNTADTVALTQAHALAGLADTANGNTADAVTLTQAHALAGVADTANGNTADTGSLTQAHALAGISDTANANTADTVVLTQAHALAGVADTANENTADTVALTQAHTLAGVADTANGNMTDSVTLDFGATLVVADTANGNTTDAVVLTQVHVLVVADTASGNTADVVVLTQAHVLAGVADTANRNTADTVALTQAHSLTGVADTANGNTTDNVVLALPGATEFNMCFDVGAPMFVTHTAAVAMVARAAAVVFQVRTAGHDMVDRAADGEFRNRTAGGAEFVDRGAGDSVVRDRSATISFVHGQPEHVLDC